MVVIALDTNFVAPRVIHGGGRNSEANLLDRMLFLQLKGYLRIALHKTTQAEVYAILRVGRIKMRGPDGKRVAKKFPHHIIMHFVNRYHDLFDVAFMDSLNRVGFDDPDTYKELLFTEIKYHLGMSIQQSVEYLQNKGIALDYARDPYDYQIMVSALMDRADYLVTTNISDFPNPLSFCRVVTEKELADVLPIYP
ncbi:hypothetical protein [Ectobacillus ponti]|uniref:PIN domain-containing protein n=1 Tax=Ectobacillus ponti TaxID=2961894 RepID=A0AA41X822_9BACI|nr:hypothetical protein [Ectobacillus ponti]MCP8970462.1 hypothetical protein [Ectobacillus ponti]